MGESMNARGGRIIRGYELAIPSYHVSRSRNSCSPRSGATLRTKVQRFATAALCWCGQLVRALSAVLCGGPDRTLRLARGQQRPICAAVPMQIGLCASTGPRLRVPRRSANIVGLGRGARGDPPGTPRGSSGSSGTPGAAPRGLAAPLLLHLSQCAGGDAVPGNYYCRST